MWTPVKKMPCDWFDLLFYRKNTQKKTLELSEDFHLSLKNQRVVALYTWCLTEKTLSALQFIFEKRRKKAGQNNVREKGEETEIFVCAKDVKNKEMLL